MNFSDKIVSQIKGELVNFTTTRVPIFSFPLIIWIKKGYEL